MAPTPKLDENGDFVKSKKTRRRLIPKDTPEYQERRDRNNVAVRKSRTQTKQKTKQTLSRVTQLRNENEQLEQQVQLLAKELGVLKDLFKMSHPVASMAGAVDAGVQVGDDEAGAAQAELFAVTVEEHASSNIEVNTRALHKDHGYVVKMESDDEM